MEELRRRGEISELREPLRNIANMRVHAERLLKNDDARYVS